MDLTRLRSTPPEELLPWFSSPPQPRLATPETRESKGHLRDVEVLDLTAPSSDSAACTGSSSEHQTQPRSDTSPSTTDRMGKRRSEQGRSTDDAPAQKRRARESVLGKRASRADRPALKELGDSQPSRGHRNRTVAKASGRTQIVGAIQPKKRRTATTGRQNTRHDEGQRVMDASNANPHKKAPKNFYPLFLSEEQKRVIEVVVEQGKSVFFTGSAGTGKSMLLHNVIRGLREKYQHEPESVAVTASTGLAASLIGGSTLHRFAGIGIGNENIDVMLKNVKKRPKIVQQWQRVKVLVLDEVSMVDAALLDKLEDVAKSIRKSPKPFGGVQLVFTGDFYQLPPVSNNDRKEERLAFDAATWSKCIDQTILLTKVYRQKDVEFAAMLDELRHGRVSKENLVKWKALERPLSFDDQQEATELFPTRNEVETANSARLRALPGKSMTYRSRDGGLLQDEEKRAKALKHCMAQPAVSFKIGAQVMLIKNKDEDLVNGSIGRVVDFVTPEEYDDQGPNHFSTEELEERLKRVDSGQGCCTQDEKWWRDMPASTIGMLMPLVRFVLADGSRRYVLCRRESWKIQGPKGETLASRSQLPLILAWALSIHKAQGQTIDRVRVNVGGAFEKGQIYVALSRATDINRLQVLDFKPNKVMADERVASFYRMLSGDMKLGRASKRQLDIRDYASAAFYEKKFVQGVEIG